MQVELALTKEEMTTKPQPKKNQQLLILHGCNQSNRSDAVWSVEESSRAASSCFVTLERSDTGPQEQHIRATETLGVDTALLPSDILKNKGSKALGLLQGVSTVIFIKIFCGLSRHPQEAKNLIVLLGRVQMSIFVPNHSSSQPISSQKCPRPPLNCGSSTSVFILDQPSHPKHSCFCLSEDLSVVTSQCSAIVRDFALWRVDRATHGLPS